ncbi:MAG TPA: hypothetical protein PKI55_06230 [Chitinophagaceae bacterium]|nr:hypothetical protein [Chitinophagaceae bacterium]
MKSNFIRPLGIAAILMLCAVFCHGQATTSTNRDSMFLSGGSISLVDDLPKKDTTKWKDTVAVMLLVCDTSIINSSAYWVKAFSVRKGEYELVDVFIDPNTTTYIGGGIYSTTLLGWLPQWENKAVYSHLEYLDDRKKPLSKNIFVWQVVSK